MSIRALLRRIRQQPRGQSFVEFALILPVFLVILSAAVDLGRLAYARVTIANVAREASFQAAQTPTSYLAGQPCTSGNESANKVICRAILESTGSVVTVTPADITMTCTPDCGDTMGNTVTVTATGRFSLVTPVMGVFFGGQTITFSSSATNQISAIPEVALGPPTSLPDLTGDSESALLASIAAANLTVGTRTEAYDPVVPAGSIISTDPAAGEIVSEGTAVDYVVSMGPAPAPTGSAAPTNTPAPTAPPACNEVSAGFTSVITPDPDTDRSPVEVTVTDTTIYNSTCPTVWVWHWGDGKPDGTGQTPTPHTYENKTGATGNIKTFTLTLTVTSGTFTSTSGSVVITVIK